MRNDTVELYLTGRTVIYPLRSLTLTSAVCNENLQHVETSAEIELVYDVEVLSLLTAASQIPAVVKDADGTLLFTGTITADISWTDSGRQAEITSFSLSIKDNTQKLRIKTPSDILLEETNLLEAVTVLVQLCGLTLEPTLPLTAIPVIYIESGKTVLDVLDALVYQYGFSFYFKPDGSIGFFDFRTIPETAPLLGENDIKADVQPKKTTKNYTGVSVSFNTLTTKTRELVYFEGNGYDSNDDPAPFVVQPGVYFPYESTPAYEELNGQQYQSFATSYAEARKKYNGEYEYGRNKEAQLLYTKNHYVENEWTGSVLIDRTGFENTRASVRLLNIGAADAHVYKLGIRADAVYRNASSTVTAGITDSAAGNIFSTSFEFVYSMKQAEIAARALLAFFSNGNFSIKFSSEYLLPVGSFFTLNTGATGFSAKIFIYKRTLNAEKDQYTYECQTVSAVTVTLTKSAVSFGATDGAALAAVATLKKALNDGDGTFIPDGISGIKASAERDGISVTWNAPGAGLKNTIQNYSVQVSLDGGSSWQDFTATDTVYFYSFDRASAKDGYPESSALLNYRIRVSAANIYGQVSAWCEPIAPDVASYGTWLLDTPVITPAVSHRSVLLRFAQPARADNRTRYGTITHRIQIRQIDTDGADEWYAPNEKDDPNISELNYKTGVVNEGYSLCTGDYSQTLPLAGQNANPAAPTYTAYQYKVCAVNESGALSESQTVTVTARPTSVVDVVRGWEYNEQGEKVKVEGALGAENIFTESLAAISANLGEINAGRLVSDLSAGETSPNVLLDLNAQEFRVGNEPSLEEADSSDAEYLHWIKGKGLFMKMKNFLLDTLGAIIKGTLTIVSAANENLRTILSCSGMEIEEKNAETGLWETTGKVTKDSYGNMIISNDPETLRPYSLKPPEGSCVYHLRENTLDLDGGNAASLVFDGGEVFTTTGTPFKTQGCMKGGFAVPIAESAQRTAFAPSLGRLTYTVQVTAVTNAAAAAPLVVQSLTLKDISNTKADKVREMWDTRSGGSAILSGGWIVAEINKPDTWLRDRYVSQLAATGLTAGYREWDYYPGGGLNLYWHIYITRSSSYPLTDAQANIIADLTGTTGTGTNTAANQAIVLLNTLPLTIATKQTETQLAALKASYEASGATLSATIDCARFYRHTITDIAAADAEKLTAALITELALADNEEQTAAEQAAAMLENLPCIIEDSAQKDITDYTGLYFKKREGTTGGLTVDALQAALTAAGAVFSAEEFVQTPQFYATVKSLPFGRYCFWFKGVLRAFGQTIFDTAAEEAAAVVSTQGNFMRYCILVPNVAFNALTAYIYNTNTAELEKTITVSPVPTFDAEPANFIDIYTAGTLAEVYCDRETCALDDAQKEHLINRYVYGTDFTAEESYFILNAIDPDKVISNAFVTKKEWEAIATGTTDTADPDDTSFAAQLAGVQKQLPSFATKAALDAAVSSLEETQAALNITNATVDKISDALDKTQTDLTAQIKDVQTQAVESMQILAANIQTNTDGINGIQEEMTAAEAAIIALQEKDNTLATKEELAEAARSSVYSVDAEQIGVWIDGRPIYRKVVETEAQGSVGIFHLGAQAEIVISCIAFVSGAACIPCSAEQIGAHIGYETLKETENLTRFAVEYVAIGVTTPAVLSGIWYTSRFTETAAAIAESETLILQSTVANVASEKLTIGY